MGFRFQRSIKIAKGVRLNLSKSGLGVSVGPRGAKISVGPRGTYANVGLPGTGLSVRQKIGGTNFHENQNYQNLEENNNSINVKIVIDENTGNETVSIFQNGSEIINDSLLRKIKKDPSFKNNLDTVRQRAFSDVVKKTNVLLDIHKHSEKMTDWNKISQELTRSKPLKYKRQDFNKKAPGKNEVISDLHLEAKQNVKGLFGLKKKRQKYVDEHTDNRYEELYINWKKEKDNFESKENVTEIKENKINQQEYESWAKEMKRLLNPDTSYVEERLEDLFSEIQLPVEFSVSFEVRDNGRIVVLDVDLPEIEDFPSKKAQKLASGKISIKDKTLKEKKEDYFTSIAGISVFFASIAYSAAPIIEDIIVSGYTQRANKATGNTEDQYVYSVRYEKNKFSQLKFENINPGETLQAFEHQINLSKTFDLKTIEPFK
ncbi:DUF4236 domain-containing protein [uncultured Ilyobacter sp.]|uniref:DUF4236 domain-containing protein n=1 Tax=uncultured Ilyobacter sp. TaxID=544433 RepID=UPI0029C661DE|nr:DUF4236 domain-containing protein [uncultured Ilyobacter sp.]